jgi:hypothetical protein
MMNANSNTAMSAQLSAVPHLPEWEICRTTKTDRRNARQHLKHIVEFDEADQIAIRKKVRYLVGFSVPDEVLFIIKSYLLLPRRNYEAKIDWWNYHHDLPYVTLRKAVFDYHQLNQHKYKNPMPLLPDTQSKAFRQLHAVLDAKPLEEEAFCDYSCLRICGNKHCEEEEGLVVRKMEYRFHDLVGVPIIMEQLVCENCIDDGADEYQCGMCGNEQVKCENLVYSDFNSDEYEYFSNYFCCVECVDEVGEIRRKKVKSCGHRWECGCDKQKCNRCVKRNRTRCDDEDCKVYYSYRNDNCDCNSIDCGYCDEIDRLRKGQWFF